MMAKSRKAMELMPGFDSNQKTFDKRYEETYQLDFLNLLTDYSPITVRETAHIPKVKKNTILGFQYFGLVDKSKLFENFIESESNHVALTSIKNFIKEDITSAIQVLYLNSGSGLGKSHLLHSVANVLLAEKKAFYLSSAFLLNADHESYSLFKNYKYILIDDIQDLDTNSEAQKLFCQLLDASYRGQFKILITSHKKIEDLKIQNERVVAKMKGAVQLNIAPMDEALIEKFIENKCNELDFKISDLKKKILKQKSSNGYSLEGAILKFKHLKELQLPEELDDVYENQTNLFDYESAVIDELLENVSLSYAITKAQLLSNRRDKEFTTPRHVAMFLLKDKMGLTLNQIGKIFNKDHTTVIYAVEKIRKRMKTEINFRELMDKF